jgi:uncharacterized protein (DUF983 family)
MDIEDLPVARSWYEVMTECPDCSNIQKGYPDDWNDCEECGLEFTLNKPEIKEERV